MYFMGKLPSFWRYMKGWWFFGLKYSNAQSQVMADFNWLFKEINQSRGIFLVSKRKLKRSFLSDILSITRYKQKIGICEFKTWWSYINLPAFWFGRPLSLLTEHFLKFVSGWWVQTATLSVIYFWKPVNSMDFDIILSKFL